MYENKCYKHLHNDSLIRERLNLKQMNKNSQSKMNCERISSYIFFLLLGGSTLHSFAGIGAGDASVKRCFEIATRPAAAQIWRKCKILIIDEISMVDGEYFEVRNFIVFYRRTFIMQFIFHLENRSCCSTRAS